MLLSLWTGHLVEKMESGNTGNRLSFIKVGMGKPTFPLNPAIAQAGVEANQLLLDGDSLQDSHGYFHKILATRSFRCLPAFLLRTHGFR